MAKVEVQIRKCFCCGLTPGTFFSALYTLLIFALLTGLGCWGLSDTVNNGDKSHYTSCELEAQGKIRADNRKLVFHEGTTKVIVEDSTSYHCSFGLYTEELKYEKNVRYVTLLVDVFLWAALIVASILCLIGLAIYNEWLLIPWILLMLIEVIRGIISVVFIFIFSHGNLARIATGIFFLGVQFFHVSILMVMIAKFQRMYNRNRGIVMDADKQYIPDSSRVYPVNNTMLSTTPYGDHGYNNYSPSQHYNNVHPYNVHDHMDYGNVQPRYYNRY
ncbi:Hypothetical protein SRAE_2000332300 [Strongyloides ratti]|uniref:Uncharacterized protein n=1 Tax=Strongyloides ratti TaxID=34506 RepID=A0A090LKJ5_STRRB|nr:Hypothetical protein SRAE_2000332300 [Strongyloides ratti]CEF68668.1 Hypothetical protein SRAE_2000332300 [Strongyloides ratti]